MSPQARRSRAKAKDAEAAEATEAEASDEEEGEKRTRNTEPFPSGEELYQAKYVDGMTWAEIRENLDERIRSPKGLALIAEHVIEAGLEDDHPEFADLSELSEKKMADAIVEWHDSGQGWSVLAARTGLTQGEVRDIYEESGGENPGRVGGQRYGGGRSRAKSEEEEAETTEEETKPASRRRGSKTKAAAEEDKSAAKPARSRSRTKAASDNGDEAAAEKPASRRRGRSAAKAA
jgi:hypothetical protein